MLEPATMTFGDVQIVSPDGRHRIAPDLWADVVLVAAVDLEPGFRAQWAARISAALSDRAALAAAASEQRRRQVLAQSLHVGRLQAFEREPATLVALDAKTAQAARYLARANELEALSLKTNRTAIKTLRANARKIGEEIAVILGAELRQVQTWGEAREPILRAEARGELVHVREAETAEVATDEYGVRLIEQSGPRRGEPALVYSRATRAQVLYGIEHAYRAKYLRRPGAPSAETLLRTGKEYAAAYVIVKGQTTNAGQEGGGGGFGPKSPQPRVIEAGNELSIMQKPLGPLRCAILDKVCGEDMRLREAAHKLGLGFLRANRLLIEGLTAAASAMHVAREEGRVGNASAGIAAVTAALRRVRA